jgi:hypothetical protein
MVSYGRAEYQHVFDRGGQVEIFKFDKEARQDYNLILPKWEYNNYTNQGRVISNLSQEQGEFLRSSLTPAEQRIVQDPTYQRAVDNLMNAPPTAFDSERAAILNEANSSQLEPYDYNLSLRHQAFNAALHQRPDVNHSIKEIDWIKDVSQAQYRSQISRAPFFNPETRLSPTPAWVKGQVRDTERRSFAAPESGTGSTDRRGSSDTNHSRAAARSATPIRAEAPPEVSKSSERIASAILGASTKTSAAQIESGVYRGQIIAATQDVLLQRLSTGSVVVHHKDLFEEGQLPQVGANTSINYSNGRATTRPVKERAKALEMAR